MENKEIKVSGLALDDKALGAVAGGSDEGNVTIRFKLLTGKIINMDVSLSGTVLDAKNKLWSVEGIPSAYTRFVFNMKELDNDKTLADCGIKDGDTVHVIFRLR